MHRRAWFAIGSVAGLMVIAACDDDETTADTNSTASSMGGNGGTGNTGNNGGDGGTGNTGNNGGNGGTGNNGGDAGMGGSGGCTQFGDDCTSGATTCCDTMNATGECFGFMMGAVYKCTIPCDMDEDCPTNHCNGMMRCDAN